MRVVYSKVHGRAITFGFIQLTANGDYVKNGERGIEIFVSLFSILLLSVIFIGGIVFGGAIQGGLHFGVDTLSAWIGAFATVAIAVLTFVLAGETWRLREAQLAQLDQLRREAMRPSIEFYLLPARASIHLFNVHIENNGKGVGRKISFRFSGKDRSPLSEDAQKLVSSFNNLSMLCNGIHSLGAGKERRSFLFSFIEFSNSLGNAVFDIKILVQIAYEDAEGRAYASETMVDLSE